MDWPNTPVNLKEGPLDRAADIVLELAESSEPNSGKALELAASNKSDPVNKPSHYRSHPSGVECIQITEHMTFNCGNAIKYIWRNGLKDEDAQVQDLEKAIWYIKREIERLTNG